MRKYFGILALLFGSFYVGAQTNKKITEEKQDSVYCLVVKDGMAVLTSSSGRVITGDIDLPNGNRISPKGLITKKNGTQLIMKDGDCTNTVADPMKKN